MSSDSLPGVAHTSAAPDRFWDQSVRVAVWSVALGIGLEVAHLVLLAFQDRLPDVARVVAAILVSMLLLRAQPNTPTMVIVGRAVAKVLFPVGCSAVIYVTERAMRLARGSQ